MAGETWRMEMRSCLGEQGARGFRAVAARMNRTARMFSSLRRRHVEGVEEGGEIPGGKSGCEVEM
jgi:hypothetical protein